MFKQKSFNNESNNRIQISNKDFKVHIYSGVFTNHVSIVLSYLQNISMLFGHPKRSYYTIIREVGVLLSISIKKSVRAYTFNYRMCTLRTWRSSRQAPFLFLSQRLHNVDVDRNTMSSHSRTQWWQLVDLWFSLPCHLIKNIFSWSTSA